MKTDPSKFSSVVDAPSTEFSTLQRLLRRGILIKERSVYSMDDPFFKRWIVFRRQT